MRPNFITATVLLAFVLLMFHGVQAVPAGNEGAKLLSKQTGRALKARVKELTLGPGDVVAISSYQRDDLSGKFRVRLDGMISLPLVGHVKASGWTPLELEKKFLTEIKSLTQKEVRISLEVDSWRPIYAVGEIEKPGVYPFTPGMTVLHALATAGGAYSIIRETNSLGVSKEIANVHRITEQLKLALTSKARIMAELNKRQRVSISKELLDLVEKDEAVRLVEAENAILRQLTATRLVKLKASQDGISLIKQEIKQYKNQNVTLKRQLRAGKAEFKTQIRRIKKGLATTGRKIQLRREITDLVTLIHTIEASTIRAKRSLIEAKQAKTLLWQDYSLKLKKQMQAIDGNVRELTGALDITRPLLGGLARGISTGTRTPRNILTFQIVRMISGYQKVIQASESTLLRPNDVVRVATGMVRGSKRPRSNNVAAR